MSRNLYKAGWVVVNNDTRVINTNELAREKLQKLASRRARETEQESEPDEDGFLSGLDAETVDALVSEDSQEAVLRSASVEEQELLDAELEKKRNELEDLNAQAGRVLENARAEAERQRTSIFEEARDQGYRDGYSQGMAEAEAIKQEYQTRKEQLEQEYQTQLEALEPEFIEAITGIYEHIFKVDLRGYHQLVYNLLADAMQKTEDSRSYMIHVSKADYPMLMEQKKMLLEETGTPADRLEIVSDMTLEQGGCMIETQSGIYDCSLGTELAELTRKLKLLSYQRN